MWRKISCIFSFIFENDSKGIGGKNKSISVRYFSEYIFVFVTFYFGIISNVPKSSKNSTRNSCIRFTEINHMFTLCPPPFSPSIIHRYKYTFLKPFRNKLETLGPFTIKYFHVYFLRTRIFSIISEHFKLLLQYLKQFLPQKILC